MDNIKYMDMKVSHLPFVYNESLEIVIRSGIIIRYIMSVLF